MSLPSCLRFPMQIRRELRLTPDGRRASLSGDRPDGLSARECGEHACNRVEAVSDRAVLDDSVRFADLVELTPAMQEDRAGIDARIDAQKRHADALEIATRQR